MQATAYLSLRSNATVDNTAGDLDAWEEGFRAALSCQLPHCDLTVTASGSVINVTAVAEVSYAASVHSTMASLEALNGTQLAEELKLRNAPLLISVSGTVLHQPTFVSPSPPPPSPRPSRPPSQPPEPPPPEMPPEPIGVTVQIGTSMSIAELEAVDPAKTAAAFADAVAASSRRRASFSSQRRLAAESTTNWVASVTWQQEFERRIAVVSDVPSSSVTLYEESVADGTLITCLIQPDDDSAAGYAALQAKLVAVGTSGILTTILGVPVTSVALTFGAPPPPRPEQLPCTVDQAAAVCAGPDEPCFLDPSCGECMADHLACLGCNAGGIDQVRHQLSAFDST